MAKGMLMNGPLWIKQWISELAILNERFRDEETGAVDFEALGREEYAFRVALMTKNFEKSERAKGVYEIAKAAYDVFVERGKKGGRPRKDSQGNDQAAQPTIGSETRTEDGPTPFSPYSRPAPVRKSCPLPKNKEEVRTFALDRGLDIDDALEWAELNLKERRGKDKAGRPITNWKGAVIRWCGAKKKKRSEQ